MHGDNLSPSERELFERLPKPPAIGSVRTTNVWIIEWLPDRKDDPRTGLQLHEWMETIRPKWSAYKRCRTKLEVIAAIERAAELAQDSGFVPILHLEAHGSKSGLSGPDDVGGQDLLPWEDLVDPLQHLNSATRCNLVVVVAACIGFAGIGAFRRGPRAPAVALVGPDASVFPRDLLSGTKELYRRLRDNDANLQRSAESASQQAGKVRFEPGPFVTLFYEAFVEGVIVEMRPRETQLHIERIAAMARESSQYSSAKIDDYAAKLPQIRPTILQKIWDDMFMIDLYPENKDRFGLDLHAIAKQIARDK